MFSFVNFIPDSPLLAFRSEALAYRLFHGRSLASRGEPFGVSFGIVGAGLSFKHTAPLLLTTKKYLAVGEVARIAEMGNAIEAMTEAGMQPDEWLDTLVLGVDDPVQQLDPGDAITGGAMNGTAGPPVTWPGKHGILTCEHVTGSKATVSCAGTAVSVIKSLNVSSTGFDVSLLELKGSLLTRYGKGSIRPLDDIELIIAGGRSGPTFVASALKWDWWPGAAATYYDLYLTDSPISTGGDSGSAAVLKGTVDVVGILVGVGSGSYVQDIDTLVGALGVSGLSL